MAYLPMLDILRAYFDIEEGDREFLIKKKMEEKILQLDEKLKGVLPPFHDILSLKGLRISGSIDPKALPDTTTSWAIECPDLITWRFTLLSHNDSTDFFTPLLSVKFTV